MASLIKELKEFEEFSWLKAFDSAAAQQLARDLETALKNAISKGRVQRFPKHKVTFKQKKLHNDSFRCVNNSNCIRVENGTISIPKIGKVPIILHRNLVSKIKTVTVQFRHGKWTASVVQEIECQAAKKVLGSIVGYDINSQHTVVGSNGWYVKNPKAFKQSKEKLSQLQQQLARRKKGSGRWHKPNNALTPLTEKSLAGA
jgi:putative transposase